MGDTSKVLVSRSLFVEAAPPPRAWVGVVSHEHVQRGVAGGFAQLCHGRHGPLARMRVGDWLVYYSPATQRGGSDALRSFTAAGRVTGAEAFRFDMGGGFVPYRRVIEYVPARRVVPVRELAARLRFVREHPNWGMLARRGHFEIPLEDAALIADTLRVAGAQAELTHRSTS